MTAFAGQVALQQRDAAVITIELDQRAALDRFKHPVLDLAADRRRQGFHGSSSLTAANSLSGRVFHRAIDTAAHVGGGAAISLALRHSLGPNRLPPINEAGLVCRLHKNWEEPPCRTTFSSWARPMGRCSRRRCCSAATRSIT